MLIDSECKIPTNEERIWELKFFRTPIKFCSVASGHVRVGSVRLGTSNLLTVRIAIMQPQCIHDHHKYWFVLLYMQGDIQHEDIECSLAVRSIGLKILCIDSHIPFDRNVNIIPNVRGRIVTEEGQVIPG